MHGMETPLEVITPVAPTSKFVHQRTALEDYQRRKVYSKQIALWERPYEDFLKPGMYSAARWAGWQGIPQPVQERYMLEEYFDKLEYLQAKRNEQAARGKGQSERAAEYALKARKTSYGVNPYSLPEALLALPKRDRIYFQEFVEAPTAKERREITQYVSPEMTRLLEAQWMRKQVTGARLRLDAGIGEEKDRTAIDQFYREKEAGEREGMPENIPIPSPNWIGWQMDDLKDIKLKTVLENSMNAHSFGFWGTDIRELDYKPYIEPISIAFQGGPPQNSSSSLIDQYRRTMRIEGTHGYRSYENLSTSDINLNIDSPGEDKLERLFKDPTIETF